MTLSNLKKNLKVGDKIIFSNNSYQLITEYGNYVNEFGHVIERTPISHPYSYEGYIIWRGGENKEANDTIYSDRMFSWDHKKFNKCSKKVFGNFSQDFSQRPAKKVEKFLREYCDNKKLKLIFIMQYCNVSSGFPLWRFDVNTNKK